MIDIRILPQDSGKKLHRYLRQALPGLPLSGVYKMIRVGRVKVNGKKGKMETVLQPGDELALYIHDEEYETISKPVKKFGGMRSDIDIIYEDGHLLVVNKPIGLLTHPDATEHKDTLIGRALAYLHRQGEVDDGRSFLPATVNRLDRNTSGIVIIGKDGPTLRQLAEVIREHQLTKTYLAIVWGVVEQDGEVDAPLLRTEDSSRTRIARAHHADALPALTRYRVLGRTHSFSLLEVELVSGRTHQIRVHMKSIGHPLVGDVKYGGKPAFDINHHVLHAYRVLLPDGREFTAPPADVFTDVLKQSGLQGYL